MAINSVCGVFCPDPDNCEHARKREADRERDREATRRVALRTGIPSYDPAMVGIHGEPDFDNLARRL